MNELTLLKVAIEVGCFALVAWLVVVDQPRLRAELRAILGEQREDFARLLTEQRSDFTKSLEQQRSEVKSLRDSVDGFKNWLTGGGRPRVRGDLAGLGPSTKERQT